MANQNFRVKHGLEVGGIEIANSSGSINTTSFADSGVSAGAVGNATHIPVITVNAKGIVTNAQTIAVTGTVSNVKYTTSNGLLEVVVGGTTYAQSIPVGNTSIVGRLAPANGVTANSSGYLSLNVGNNQLVSNTSGLYLNETNIDIHNLSGYVANENIDHSSVSVVAGDGLAGGGTIAASRTLSVNAQNGLVSNSSGLFVRAGTGVVTNSTGVHIGQAVGTTDTVTFADITITGNLTVQGAQTTVDTNDLVVNDAIITIASGQSGTPSLDAGLEVDRGSSANARLYWDESTDKWSHQLVGGSEYTLHTTAADVELGTHTSGNYMAAISAANGVSISHTPGEGSTGTVGLSLQNGLFSNTSGVYVNAAQIGITGLSGYDANEHIDHSGVTLSAGNGLSGGGDITSSRSFAVLANTGVSANSTGVFAVPGEIDHDSLSNFIANEHINHSSVSVTAGNGLTGGGDITASRTLAVNANNGLISNSSGVFVKANTGIVANSSGLFAGSGGIEHDDLSGFVANEHIDHSSVSVSAGNGLSGGGDLTATRTLSVKANTGITSNSSGVFTNDSEIVHDSLSGFVANEHIDHSTVSISPGNGLSGGGTIAATRTLSVKANTGLSANSSGLFVAPGSVDHDSLSNFVANEHIDHSSVSMSAGNGLTGGGDITSSRSFAVKANTGITANSSGVFTNDSEIVHDSLSGFVADEHIAHSGVSISAGNGLSGGGNIAASRSLAVRANNGILANASGVFAVGGTGVTVNATGIHVGQSVGTTDNVEFGNLIVSGNLTVSGTQTILNTETLTVNDNIITLLAGLGSVAPTSDAGFEVNRGNAANASLYWDESTDRWTHKLAGGTEYVLHTKANDIALGTDTSGNYVDNVTAGNGIAVTGSAGEGWEPAVAVKANTGITANSSGVFTNDSQIVHDSLSGFVANEHINHSSVSISAGNGLTGGGNITTTRTLTVGAGNGISTNSTAVAVVGGTGVTSNSTGVHIGQAVATNSNVTFNNVDVDGDLRDGSNRVFKVYNAAGTVVWG